MGLFARKDQMVGSVCGHTFPRSGFLYEDSTPIGDFESIGKPRYCPICTYLGRTLCVWCHKKIFFGDPVTLYSPTKPNYDGSILASFAVYTRRPIRLIGCMKCADDTEHAAGFWEMRLRDGRPYFYVWRNQAFCSEKGTVAISRYTLVRLREELQTERQIISPIPLVGNGLSWSTVSLYRVRSEVNSG